MEEADVVRHATVTEGVWLNDIAIAALLADHRHRCIVRINDLKLSAARAARTIFEVYKHRPDSLLCCEETKCSDTLPAGKQDGEMVAKGKAKRKEKRSRPTKQQADAKGDDGYSLSWILGTGDLMKGCFDGYSRSREGCTHGISLGTGASVGRSPEVNGRLSACHTRAISAGRAAKAI